jgi:hypothetical protein
VQRANFVQSALRGRSTRCAIIIWAATPLRRYAMYNSSAEPLLLSYASSMAQLRSRCDNSDVKATYWYWRWSIIGIGPQRFAHIL